MTLLAQIAHTFPEFEPGTVWLVGAGPGDPGLLTLLALYALQQADVVVYDALVADETLALARIGAELEFAGKRGGRPSAHQDDISKRLVELAKENKRVVRLKGGDPFIFGRGGEEAQELVAAGVRFRVVPGPTAGLAGLAYAGIPATTRGANRGVILATGHSALVEEDSLDWRQVAKLNLPLVLYMAMRKLERIASELIEGGAAADTPVAIVEQATTPKQRVLRTTLEHAVRDATAEGYDAPSIVAIGAIVDLREILKPMLLNEGG